MDFCKIKQSFIVTSQQCIVPGIVYFICIEFGQIFLIFAVILRHCGWFSCRLLRLAGRHNLLRLNTLTWKASVENLMHHRFHQS